jgi:hypothetical protein
VNDSFPSNLSIFLEDFEKSKSLYPANEYGSIDHLAAMITEYTRGWNKIWYRGTRSRHDELLPRMLRRLADPQKEKYRAHEFRRRAHARLKDMNSNFDWLCAMQHYGVPTRLLDWTESLSVALFFSVTPDDSDEVPDPTIWVLNPLRLYGLTEPNCESVPNTENGHAVANANIAFAEDYERSIKLNMSYAIPVAPNFLFERLAMQNGLFTIHGTDARPIEMMIPPDQRDMLLKFVPHRNKLDAIFDCINLIKPSSDALFPDMGGLKDYIG